MDRRQFGKSALGLLSFSLLPGVEKVHDVPVLDLSPFCDIMPGCRWEMDTPFVQEGILSATDGRAGVRLLDAWDYADRNKDRRIPPLKSAFENTWKPNGSWLPWPEADYIAEPNVDSAGCFACLATGITSERSVCDRCRGWGTVSIETDDEWDEWEEESPCSKCSGRGFLGIKCARCDGKPYRDDLPSRQFIDDHIIAARYHAPISRLPGVEYCRIDEYKPIVFRFDGGQGLVMPMLRPKDRI